MLIEHWPVHQRVTGWIPVKDMYLGCRFSPGPNPFSPSLSIPFTLSKKSKEKSSSGDGKKTHKNHEQNIDYFLFYWKKVMGKFDSQLRELEKNMQFIKPQGVMICKEWQNQQEKTGPQLKWKERIWARNSQNLKLKWLISMQSRLVLAQWELANSALPLIAVVICQDMQKGWISAPTHILGWAFIILWVPSRHLYTMALHIKKCSNLLKIWKYKSKQQ